jgi:hypothetical protein
MPKAYGTPGPRVLYPDCCTSQSLAECSMGAQLLFDRLIVQSDDQGRQQADPPIIKAVCFPYFPEATPRRISVWLAELEKAGMVVLYSVGKAALVQLRGWWTYQSGMRRAYPSRWGAPPDWSDRVFGVGKSEQDDGNLPAERGQPAGNPPRTAPDFPPHARGSGASAYASAGASAGNAPAADDPDDDITTLQKLAESLTGTPYGFPRHGGMGEKVAVLVRKHGLPVVEKEWRRIAADEGGLPTVRQLVLGADNALNRISAPAPTARRDEVAELVARVRAEVPSA